MKLENLKSKIIPRTIDIIRGLVRFEQVRDIKPQDLLGRPVVKHDLTIASEKDKDKIILITGAAGSIGSELAKQMAEQRVDDAKELNVEALVTTCPFCVRHLRNAATDIKVYDVIEMVDKALR